MAFIAAPGGYALTDSEHMSSWPKGKVFSPKKLFLRDNELAPNILESNPRLFLFPELKPDHELIMVIGMPGWGGRSENFIGCLTNGLKQEGLTSRLVLAALQDPLTHGPQYQGQGGREHANLWRLNEEALQILRRFILRVANELGHLQVYFMGYSTGSVSAPLAAVGVASMGKHKRFTIKGAISLGTGSPVPAYKLKSHNLRVLFLTVPHKGSNEKPALRYDQGNRANTLRSFALLQEGGARVYLRSIESARRHIDWHWGLMSQCRYFPPRRLDDGRGYWPHYWLPNPETFEYIVAFIQGHAPPEKPRSHPPSTCPFDP